MKVIYVAGPYSAQHQYERDINIANATRFGALVAEAGACPLIPHANTGALWGTKTPEFWYAATEELLLLSQGAVFIPGWQRSKGSIAEMKLCVSIGIPFTIFDDGASLYFSEAEIIDVLKHFVENTISYKVPSAGFDVDHQVQIRTPFGRMPE